MAFVVLSVCLIVCLSVCQQDYLQSNQRICMKFFSEQFIIFWDRAAAAFADSD